MQWVSLGIIVVFGGATLLLHDETFIKWKPTVLYWTGGAAFLARPRLPAQRRARDHRRRDRAAGAGVDAPRRRVGRLLPADGRANLYVAFNYPTASWVNFKVFGSFGLIVAFVIAQSLWIARYLPDEHAKPVAVAKANEPPQA